MSDRMRDTRQGHIKEEIEGVCVCCRHASLERFIDRCVSERSVETVGERPKKRMCVMDRMLREGEGEEGVCMHE